MYQDNICLERCPAGPSIDSRRPTAFALASRGQFSE